MASATQDVKSSKVRRSVLDGFSFAFFAIVILFVIFNPTEDQQLNLKMDAAIFFGAYVVGIVVSTVLNNMGIKTLGEHLFQPDYKKAQEVHRPLYRTFWGWHLILLLLLLFIVGIFKTNFSIWELLN